MNDAAPQDSFSIGSSRHYKKKHALRPRPILRQFVQQGIMVSVFENKNLCLSPLYIHKNSDLTPPCPFVIPETMVLVNGRSMLGTINRHFDTRNEYPPARLDPRERL